MKRRTTALLASAVAAGLLASPSIASADAPSLEVGDGTSSLETTREKIDVMGIWAHPDDDAGFTTPCGIWNDLYDVTCGIIMATRGEGGSNSVGPEAGADLGLRRENEDRTSHVRSGTVDIFNLDRVDFYYNTSAPLTGDVWDADDTLRRTVRIIRETKPEILVGWTPSLDAGHGNHQYAQGRMVWEAATAAADPNMYPEQLTGLGAVEPWQVKRILSQGYFGHTGGEGGAAGPGCNAGFVPATDNPYTVLGTWTGYDSPYTWADGNVQGQNPGSAKTWAQVGYEGGRAHPTQARSMVQDLAEPECMRFGVDWSIAPMQPNGSDGAGLDEAVLHGAVLPDPGGLPLGSLFAVETEDNYVAAGEPFDVTVDLSAGEGMIPSGEVSLDVPDGWDASAPAPVDEIAAGDTAEVTLTVTPAADADTTRYRLAAKFDGSDVTAYNDTRVDLVAPVDGRFERTGNTAEYEEWMEHTGAYVGGEADAIASIGAGETITVPVNVTNRSAEAQQADVSLSAPDGFALDEETLATDDIAPGESQTVTFTLTSTDPSDPGSRTEAVTATTRSVAGISTEELTLYVVPTTTIPHLESAPVIDGESDDVYEGEPLNIGVLWEGDECEPDGIDCGGGSEASIGWHDDALYVHTRVTDDIASAAATPDRCFGHWLVDSVELLLDPRGAADDTSTTFKLGVFPFTDDPEGTNGNGPDGPCWSRDADNHQGFSTGPHADDIEGAPNAPGVEVAVVAARNDDGTYVDGTYEVEVKVPLADLPAAVGPTGAAPTGDAATNTVDPDYLGLNLTPYDSDTQDFIGKTRTAWSAFGSQQSEPHRWGHAYLDGYEPPTDRSTEAPEAIIPDTALQGVDSPQTVYQSAVRGGTISGAQPSDALSVHDVTLDADGISVPYDASAEGALDVFVWSGDPRTVPVWTSSCPDDEYGFDACSSEDGAAPAWAPDMGRHLVASAEVEVVGSGQVDVPLDAEQQAQIAEGAADENAYILVSYAQSTGEIADGVAAWAFPIQEAEADPTPEPTAEPTAEPTPEPTVEPTPDPTSDPTAEPSERPDPSEEPSEDPIVPSGGDMMTPLFVAGGLILVAGTVLLVARRRSGS